MLSNKPVYFMLSFLIALFIISCGERKQPVEKVKSTKDYNNPAVVTTEAEKILGQDMKFAYKGNFDKDSSIEIAAGTEIENKSEWGIQFYLLKLEQNKFEKTFQTNLFKGSFKESLFMDKEKIFLFLSNNIDNSDIKNFFIANFKRDYPNLKIVSKDVNIDI
ncbi:MAG: hypothetical protein P8Z35_17650 [Ignavibacteriaceae bacterium]